MNAPLQAAQRRGVSIDCVDGESGWDTLQADWRRLEAIDPHASIFLSWDWQRLWWRHYGAQRALRLLVARSGGRVVGLLPLYTEVYRAAGGLLRVRKLRQVGIGGDTAPDDLGALIDPAFAPEVAAAFAERVVDAMAGWDLLDWSDLPPHAELTGAVTARLAAAGLRLLHKPSEPITWGELPRSWEDYLAGLSRSRRETLRRKRRKFESQPRARVRVIDDPAELDAAFERLGELHRKRWQARTAIPGFTSGAYRGFHRELMHTLLPRNRLRLLALDVQGETIAMLYGLQWRGVFSFFQGGFDPDRAALSPGDVIMAYAVERAIGEGCTAFDMLKGDHEYKRQFFKQSWHTVELRAFRPGVIDWAYRLREQLRPPSAAGQAMAEV